MSSIEKALHKRSDADANTTESELPRTETAGYTPRSQASAGSSADAKTVDIDLVYLRDQGVWPPPAMEVEFRDQYRRIKRPIVQNALGRSAVPIHGGNLIAITSSIESEGKTFTSLNLALSLSEEIDCEALLVDLDVMRRSSSILLGVDQRPGITDLLANPGLTFADVIVPTTYGSLSLLPAGHEYGRSREHLASERMENVLSRLAADNPRRVIILDCPPLLPAPEAVSIANQVGQVALVVKAGTTERHLVVAAVEQLDPEKPVNLILNQSRRSHTGDYYGGYYGYHGYGD